MAVLAPIPRVSERTATALKTGARRKLRTTNSTSWTSRAMLTSSFILRDPKKVTKRGTQLIISGVWAPFAVVICLQAQAPPQALGVAKEKELALGAALASEFRKNITAVDDAAATARVDA